MKLVLTGCRPEPLGSYLRALALLRIVGEQRDSTATGHWTDAGFVLNSILMPDELIRFLLDSYTPTPMIAPWTAGSGFIPGDSDTRTARERLEKAESSTSGRFHEVRRAIAVGRRIFDESTSGIPDRSVKAVKDQMRRKEMKEQIISRCRSEMPDSAVVFIDAAVALTDSKPVYPYILGTGFNLGRMDLTSNYLAHLDEVLGFGGAPNPNSEAWLRDALYGGETAPRVDAKAGQFDPGHAGGVNMSTLDGGDALVNPWSFVLGLEGALLFASSVNRRLGTWRDSVAAMPFMVRATEAGAPHLSAEESTKGELWLPLWETPARLPEVRQLFSEARLRWRGAPATTGVDAARAVATLGVDRGLTAFSRTVIAERLGQSPLAISAGRVDVSDRPAARLTSQLDDWIGAVGRIPDPPRAISQGLRAVREAMIDVATGHDDRPLIFLRLIEAVADMENALRKNAKLRDGHRPLPLLEAAGWLPVLDDGSVEFAIAWAFASMAEESSKETETKYPTVWRPSMRAYVRGITGGSRPNWAQGPRLGIDLRKSPAVTFSRIHAAHATKPRPIEGFAGGMTTMKKGVRRPASELESFAAGSLDDRAVGRFARVLCFLGPGPAALKERSQSPPPAVAPAWRVLAPVFHGHEVGRDLEGLIPDPWWPAALARGAVEPVLRAAMGRLRSRVGETKTVDFDALASTADPAHVTAALLLAIPPKDLTSLVGSITNRKELT